MKKGTKIQAIMSIITVTVMIAFTYVTFGHLVDLDGTELNMIDPAIMIIIGMIVSFAIYPVIHEVGHVIFGLISGYKLDALLILDHAFIKTENGHLRRRAYVPGAMGATVMHPMKNNSKYVLYILGGSVTTAVAMVIFTTIMLFSNNVLVDLFLYPVSAIGCIQTIYNIIPFNHKGIYSDGMILNLFRKDKRAIEIFSKSEIITIETLKGVPLANLPEETFDIPDGYETVPFSNELRLNKAEYLLCKERYAEAEKELETILRYADETNNIVCDISKCLLLLTCMISGADKERIELIYQTNKEVLKDMSKYNLTAKYAIIAYKIKIEGRWNLDKDVNNFYALAKRQGATNNVELKFMKKLLQEHGMSYLIQSI